MFFLLRMFILSKCIKCKNFVDYFRFDHEVIKIIIQKSLIVVAKKKQFVLRCVMIRFRINGSEMISRWFRNHLIREMSKNRIKQIDSIWFETLRFQLRNKWFFSIKVRIASKKHLIQIQKITFITMFITILRSHSSSFDQMKFITMYNTMIFYR